MMSLTAADNIS